MLVHGWAAFGIQTAWLGCLSHPNGMVGLPFGIQTAYHTATAAQKI